MSRADDMLTLIWSSKSQKAWTSSSLGGTASCTSGVAIVIQGAGMYMERDLKRESSEEDLLANFRMRGEKNGF